MKIAITGSTGLIGSALVPFLIAAGHTVVPIVRGSGEGVRWNPALGEIDAEALEGIDAVVHLAGESVAGRWTEDKMGRIRDSRILGTSLLAKTLAGLAKKPRVFVSMSAVGFYGDRGDDILTEDCTHGEGFLANVVTEWETVADPARDAGIRVVHPRMGIVLSPAGGALAQMLPFFQWGVGGVIGNGSQYFSWVSVDDAIGIILFCLTRPITGPVNATAPNPVTNREYTKTLGHVLIRPTILPIPAFALRTVYGHMADEALLASQRAVPSRLQELGYQFRWPQLEPALRYILGR